MIKRLDEYSMENKIFVERKCPYCNNRLKENDTIIFGKKYFVEFFICEFCKKYFKVKATMGDEQFHLILEAKEISFIDRSNNDA